MSKLRIILQKPFCSHYMKAEAVFETMAALPDLPGPKLYPLCYEGQTLEIDFIEHIAVGADATIWKVSIEKNTYALKIVSLVSESCLTFDQVRC